MALKEKEIAISKAVSVKLNDQTIAIIAHVYHTADRKANPDDKSWYKYVGRVVDITDLKAEIEDKRSDANRLKNWEWKCPAWPDDMYFGYDRSNANSKGARWLEMRLKKALEWDDYVKVVRDGIKKIARTGYEKQYPTAAYETEAYQKPDGSTISILDLNALLAAKGTPFWKNCLLKRDLPKA